MDLNGMTREGRSAIQMLGYFGKDVASPEPIRSARSLTRVPKLASQSGLSAFISVACVLAHAAPVHGMALGLTRDWKAGRAK